MRGAVFVLSILLPVFWAGSFTAQGIAGTFVCAVLFAISIRLGFQLASSGLLAAYWAQIYFPVANTGGIWSLAACCSGLVLFSTWALGRNRALLSGNALPLLATNPSLWLSAAVPFSIGCVVVLTFHFSPLNLPPAFVPSGAVLSALIVGCLWLGLAGLSLTRVSEFGQVERTGLFLAPAAVAALLLFGNIWPTIAEVRALRLYDRPESSHWLAALKRTESFGIPSYDRYARKAALESVALRDHPEIWVEAAKGSDRDLSEEVEGPGEFWRLLAWGGDLWPARVSRSASEVCVGMEVDFQRRVLWALTAGGELLRYSDAGREVFQIPAVQTRYVDCAVSKLETGLFLLENCGRLAHFNGTDVETLSEGICDPSRQVLRRLKTDPTSGEVWAMDFFGDLYHSPRSEGWSKDSRFREISKRGDLDVDVARDFCLSPTGTIAMLTCDGEVWTSSREASQIFGPYRETHYFPDYPAAQSIGWKRGGYHFTDRHGGFFHVPYPSAKTESRWLGSYLFPRGVFLDEDEVERGFGAVDHEYNEERRWLYLLTGDGQLLTNFKGMRAEAD